MVEPWLAQLYPENADRRVLLEHLSWTALKELIDRGDDLLLLPVGATEQHGPHLPISTDTLIATSACQAASALTGAAMLPAISYSVSIGHTEKWPGTFALFHETLIATVREITRWAAATGWRRLLIINSHLGNDAPLRCAVDRLRFDLVGQMLVATRNTWSLTPEISNAFSSDAADWHANEAETSILQFIAPHLVAADFGSADDVDRTGGCVFPHMVAHTSLNGVTGRPSGATPAKGAALLRKITDALVELIGRSRREETPLEWSRQARAFAA